MIESIQNVDQLENLLSEPTAGVVETMRRQSAWRDTTLRKRGSGIKSNFLSVRSQ